MRRKIIIAEDHVLMARSIRSICKARGIEMPDEVQTCQELIKALSSKEYTHLILDLTLADGSSLSLLPVIFEKYISLKILVYSTQPARLFGDSLYRSYGIQYISKNEQEHRSIKQLIEFLNDESASPLRPDKQTWSPFDALSLRQKALLPYLLRGWEPARIAEEMALSAITVRVQKKNILEKMNADNLFELKELAVVYQIPYS